MKSKIFQELNASIYQGQHATQFKFCRYEGLRPATETESHRGCFPWNFCEITTATFENSFGGIILKRKQRKTFVTEVTLVISSLHYSRAVVLKSRNNLLSPEILT